jgi:hypothetical protein
MENHLHYSIQSSDVLERKFKKTLVEEAKVVFSTRSVQRGYKEENWGDPIS